MSLSKLFLREVGLKPACHAPGILRHVFPMRFNKNISIIIGENGSGKSTLLEAIAIKLGCNPEGGGRNFHFKTEDTHSSLHEALRLTKGYRKERDLFFYRAESFYNVTTEIRNLDAAGSFDPKINTYYGGRDLHELSHGEAMEALYQHRFKENGLYILDEPEASLSAQRQLNFIIRICELAEGGAQFVIATHSPILMFTPGCDLFKLEGGVLEPTQARDTELFNLYRAVISSSGAFLEKMLHD
ncbi:AAA family ATPase [Pseudomonas sp. p1(2021b)]|uniref:AAA family ATPase n=1 Tax=Pseudomonas sp. p1(2021b) TaxID=2874628 RepID=UPI001CCC6796|nr:AAA family ATPase [Pseudomonas sp. p1(2021b)]UBM24942.1 AAA family ATPase [Pseudomonas sp. p1(2021b)]